MRSCRRNIVTAEILNGDPISVGTRFFLSLQQLAIYSTIVLNQFRTLQNSVVIKKNYLHNLAYPPLRSLRQKQKSKLMVRCKEFKTRTTYGVTCRLVAACVGVV